MDSEQLKDILTKHCAWMNDENGGVRADLSRADLKHADLSGVEVDCNTTGYFFKGCFL